MSVKEMCPVLHFKDLGDERGKLVVIEGEQAIPFCIRRVFYIYDSDSTVVRGQHANRESEFVLINVAGKSKVRITDGKETMVVELNEPMMGVYIPKMIWKDMYDFSPDSVLLVLASTHYNGEEYIRFDDKGNIFLLGQEWQDGKDSINTIYRWNSANGLQKYSLDEKINYIANFTISNDGSWVFVNADVKTDNVEDNNYNAVYAFEVNTNKAPVTLYQSKKGKRWAVPTIAVDPQNRVYFYASAWDDPMGVDGGLFVLNKTSSGYSASNLKRYKLLRWHEIDNFVRTAVKTDAAKRTVVRVSDMVGFDYEKLLADIKSYTNYVILRTKAKTIINGTMKMVV